MIPPRVGSNLPLPRLPYRIDVETDLAGIIAPAPQLFKMSMV